MFFVQTPWSNGSKLLTTIPLCHDLIQNWSMKMLLVDIKAIFDYHNPYDNETVLLPLLN